MAANPVADATVQAKIQSLIATSETLASKWTTIISDANANAYREVRRRLVTRGYTIAQVEAWECYSEYILDIGCYLALAEGGLYSQESQAHIELRKKRNTLDECVLLDSSGKLLELTNNYTVDYGDLDTDSTAVFDFSGNGDPETQITQW